jgi:signal transduction histidine kinase
LRGHRDHRAGRRRAPDGGAARPRRGSGRHPQCGQRAGRRRYRGFVELVANQIGSGLLNAGSYEDERLRAEALAELDRAKTDFFSNVSHGFRTPLTLIMGPVAARLAERPAGARVELDLGWASYLPSAGVGMIVLVLAGSADVLAAGTTESVAEPPRG